MSATLETALDKSGQPVKRGTMAHDHHVYMLLTESAASKNQSPTINSVMASAATQGAADKSKAKCRERAVRLVFMLHLV